MRALRKRTTRMEPGATVTERCAEGRGLSVRIRADLERRGVSSERAGPIASHIAPRAEGLDPVRYAVLLDGAAAAHATESGTSAQGAAPAPAEIQRLVKDFAIELKKLDEGLRLLSTYLLRIRDRATEGEGEGRTVH